jgi:hypothetical protein
MRGVSEYHYYEFVVIDRPLDEGQLGEVRAVDPGAHHADELREHLRVGQLPR